MKTLQSIAVWLLVTVPILYFCSYVAFLQATKPGSDPSIALLSDSVTVLTNNEPLKTHAVTAFKPLMAVHSRVLGGNMRVMVHEFG